MFTLFLMAVVSMMLILTIGLFLIIDSDCCCINSGTCVIIINVTFESLKNKREEIYMRFSFTILCLPLPLSRYPSFL